MGSSKLSLAEPIFLKAIELPVDQRTAYVQKACAGDARLAEVVGDLVRKHELAEAGGFMSDPTIAGLPHTVQQLRPSTGTPADQPTMPGSSGGTPLPPPIIGEQPGDMLGPYKLLQLIGEGGFGSVYLAEQREPIRRRVAVKIIKAGMDTRQVITRFEAERQALALMDHPNIAKVLDAGATASGRPFFVMELVKGVPITDFCDSHRLSVEQRLEVFADVCSAVQHAHIKGVMHRDLKPSNILVAEHDGRPLVKVIDFGIAKATETVLTDKTLFTEFWQRVGTPEYMSPEHAAGSLDIDTRTDVYSLGVLLYELLTGSTPFDSKRLRSAAQAEVHRIIREEEPPTPSIRLNSLLSAIPQAPATPEKPPSVESMQAQVTSTGPTPAVPSTPSFRRPTTPGVTRTRKPTTAREIATSRATDPNSLFRLIKGDLDLIVMKCLEKDRARRYESPSSVAADLTRFLRHEPIFAKPPSHWYRFHKFARRHRALVSTAAAMLLLAATGVMGVALSLNRALHAEQAERSAKIQAQATLRAVKEFAVGGDTFRMAPISSTQRFQAETTAEVIARLELPIAGSPLLEASLLEIAGRYHANNFQAVPACADFQRAIRLRLENGGLDDHDGAVLLTAWVDASLRMKAAEAPPEAKFLTHDEQLETIQRAIAVLERTRGKNDPDTLDARLVLCKVLDQSGDERERSLATLESELLAVIGAFGDANIVTANVRLRLGQAYLERRRQAEAVPLLDAAFAVYQRQVGDQHVLTRLARKNLAAALLQTDQWAKAEPILAADIRQFDAVMGPDGRVMVEAIHDRNSARARINLARAREKLGDSEGARSMLIEAINDLDKDNTTIPQFQSQIRQWRREALELLVPLLARLNRPSEAEAWAERIRNEPPAEPGNPNQPPK